PSESNFSFDADVQKIIAELGQNDRGEELIPPTPDPDPAPAIASPQPVKPEEPEPEPPPVEPRKPRSNAFLSVRCDGTWIYVDGTQMGSCSLGATRIRVTPGKHVVQVETTRGMLRGVVRARANRDTPVRLKKKRVVYVPQDEVVRVPTD
ncbi:MAG: hypothetical protein AAFY60_12060, partial [Myxococcota bacterium]